MLEKGNLENRYSQLENHAKGFARQRRSIYSGVFNSPLSFSSV
jgi:hypothetical protein